MGQSSFDPASALPSLDTIKHWLTNRIATSLGIQSHEIEIDAPFARYGIDSMQAITILRALLEDLYMQGTR